MANEQKPLMTFQRRVRWRNKHLNVERQVERLYDAWNRWSDGSRPAEHVWRAGLMALQQIVRDAAAQGRRVRAVGGAWSLSEAATTNDFLVNTRPLNYVDVGLSPAELRDDVRREPRRIWCSRSAARPCSSSTRCSRRRGWRCPTSGASNGQTIAGAIATGTHGAANTVGAMQDYVVGLHVVGEDGRHYWIERASRPVVSPSFVARLGAELRRDDSCSTRRW